LAPDPDHLFDQADRLAGRLTVPPASETEPRQTDLRRAISAAYYALFHFTLAAASDLFVGRDKRSTPEYRMTYRSVLREPEKGRFGGYLCKFPVESNQSGDIHFVQRRYAPRDREGFGIDFNGLGVYHRGVSPIFVRIVLRLNPANPRLP
jgi:hypothetical protein